MNWSQDPLDIERVYPLVGASSDGKESACNAGDPDLVPGLGKSPGEGIGNPLLYSCLENPMDEEAWSATVYGVAKSPTRLSDFIDSLILF